MKKMIELPKFVSEDDEANWWASRAGGEYLKLKSAQQLSEGKRAKGSKMIEQLKEKTSAACIVTLPDRLLHHADVTVLEGNSYRVRESEHATGDPITPPSSRATPPK